MSNESVLVNYVKTNEIRQAVRGHETNVLDALGVDWRAGRPHISCPYPGHADGEPSWRWDVRKDRAFCTCTTSDSIFDVVSKVEGGTFETAKIRVAELLGMQHLIRSKGVTNRRQHYQASDAASLLSAPDRDRDDGLPAAYLGHRLGVAIEAVPIPRTPMLGLKALGYYDPPPPGSKARPKLVGAFPCAVFGTIAADGGTHAHRIYLAQGGSAKADLGVDPTGRRRDPKKSARVLGDDNTSGRSVLWGDPDRASHLVVTEGIETGAALALAMGREVEAGEVAIAAAISANGVEAFQPYRNTTDVTIAADRDEAVKPDGTPGSRRGERAARAFSLKHHEAMKVDIALPGASGESADWLNVLLRDGADAVRRGILTAEPFVPRASELDEAKQDLCRLAELRQIEATYPLPAMQSMTLVYRHTAGGAVKVHKVLPNNDFEARIPIATPFGITARLRHIDQADSYGLRCTVQDMSGKPRAVDFERAALARMGATDVRARLFAAGLRTEDDGEGVAVQCLKAADPSREILIVQRTGWHEVPGIPDPVFVCPDGTVLGAPPGAELELSAAARLKPDVAVRGTLDGWRRASEAAIAVSDCPHWTIGVMAAFAGPIVALAGLDTCGVHLSGMSSSGKSKAQRLAASAWSTPDIRRSGLSQSARATDNAVEALAQRGSGTVLVLDELAHVSGKQAEKMIYTIAGGAGKRRMNADAEIKDSYAWATFTILSGECSLQEKIRSDGGEWLAGMAVRIVDIDVTDVNRSVSAETLRLIDDIEEHYGHAGPAFVRSLVEHGLHRKSSELRERVLGAARRIVGDAADGAMVRAATPFALMLIAGELAKNFGLIPPSIAVTDAIMWAWQRFFKSSDATALDPDAQAIEATRGWIAERWNVTIKSVDDRHGINNREAVAWYDNSAIYIPTTRLREAAGNALRETQVASILDRHKMLAKRPEADRLYVRYIPQIGRLKAYALRRSEFGRSEEPADVHAYTVHQGGRNA